MKGLTTLDYINLAALLISTLLIGAVQLLHWNSPAMMLSMIVLVVIVIINSIAVRKYRRQFKQGAVPTMTPFDRRMGQVMMGVIGIVVIYVLWAQLK